jgi:hypothetical protein
MGAYAWMRYSYCWELGPSGRWLPRADGWPSGAYVRVRPEVGERLVDYLDRHGAAPAVLEIAVVEQGGVGADGLFRAAPLILEGIDGDPETSFIRAAAEGRTISGRIKPWDHEILAIDETSSRLTGESVAGLVVGAMGCAVFGLYLRRWLRERRAAALADG